MCVCVCENTKPIYVNRMLFGDDKRSKGPTAVYGFQVLFTTDKDKKKNEQQQQKRQQ